MIYSDCIMNGLENKLDRVYVGDLIMLQSPQLEVSGYVIDFNQKQVKLSHENPFSEMAGVESWQRDYRGGWFTSGDKLYNLKMFKSYEILREHKNRRRKQRTAGNHI